MKARARQRRGTQPAGLGAVFAGAAAESISQFKIALRLKPDLAAAHVNLANALVKNGALAEAESEARTALRLSANDAEAHRTLGKIASFRSDPATAATELKKAVDLQPQRADLRDELGSVLAQSSQADEAAKQFSEALRLQPELCPGRLASWRGALAAETNGRSSQPAAARRSKFPAKRPSAFLSGTRPRRNGAAGKGH